MKPGPAIPMIGLRFGRLVVQSLGANTGGGWSYVCLCDCGQTTTVLGGNLRNKARGTRSCGCLAREVTAARATKHGLSRTKGYALWAGIIARCFDPNAPSYERYGGRGITVCDRWRDYAAFVADMGERPSPHHSIDRIDNNGNYEPGNCRWATMREQQNNRSSNVHVVIDGVRMTVAQAARLAGIQTGTMCRRVKSGVAGRDLLRPLRGTG